MNKQTNRNKYVKRSCKLSGSRRAKRESLAPTYPHRCVVYLRPSLKLKYAESLFRLFSLGIHGTVYKICKGLPWYSGFGPYTWEMVKLVWLLVFHDRACTYTPFGPGLPFPFLVVMVFALALQTNSSCSLGLNPLFTRSSPFPKDKSII